MDSINVKRNTPFCWQSRETLSNLREQFKGAELTKYRNLYLTISELHAEFGNAPIKNYTKTISKYSGLSRVWLLPALKQMEDLGIIYTTETERDGGKFTGTVMYITDNFKCENSESTAVSKTDCGEDNCGDTVVSNSHFGAVDASCSNKETYNDDQGRHQSMEEDEKALSYKQTYNKHNKHVRNVTYKHISIEGKIEIEKKEKEKSGKSEIISSQDACDNIENFHKYLGFKELSKKPVENWKADDFLKYFCILRASRDGILQLPSNWAREGKTIKNILRNHKPEVLKELMMIFCAEKQRIIEMNRGKDIQMTLGAFTTDWTLTMLNTIRVQKQQEENVGANRENDLKEVENKRGFKI